MRMLRAQGHDADKVWSDVVAVVVKSLIGIAPLLAASYQELMPKSHVLRTSQSSCFEILGYDVMMDDALKVARPVGIAPVQNWIHWQGWANRSVPHQGGWSCLGWGMICFVFMFCVHLNLMASLMVARCCREIIKFSGKGALIKVPGQAPFCIFY